MYDGELATDMNGVRILINSSTRRAVVSKVHWAGTKAPLAGESDMFVQLAIDMIDDKRVSEVEATYGLVTLNDLIINSLDPKLVEVSLFDILDALNTGTEEVSLSYHARHMIGYDGEKQTINIDTALKTLKKLTKLSTHSSRQLHEVRDGVYTILITASETE